MLPVSERGYMHPELLTETDWLAGHLTDPNVRVVDARSADDFAEGHIPGAVNITGFSLGGVRTGPEMPEADDFAGLAGGLGIDETVKVVVYDATGPQAGVVAWAFLYYGHPDAQLLDGGLTKWSAEGLPLDTESSAYEPRTFSAQLVEPIYCNLDEAKASIGQDGVVFWDTRSWEEFQGTTVPNNAPPRLGHLPGAIHLNWTELYDADSRTLKPATELIDLLQARGITPEMVVVTY